MKKIDRLKGKRIALNKLSIESMLIAAEMLTTPGYVAAIIDRQKHIDRGELWLTPAMVKFSPFYQKLAALQAKMSAVRAISSKYFRENGTLDKRRYNKGCKPSPTGSQKGDGKILIIQTST